MVKKASFHRKKIQNLTKKFFPKVQEFESEVDLIIMQLRDRNVNCEVKKILREYAIISAVSIFEYFFKNLAYMMVNRDNIDISRLITKQSILELKKNHPELDDGQILVSVFEFSDPNIVNKVFSQFFGLKLFKSIEIINNDDPYRNVGGGRPIKINWKNFYNMFQFRNNRLHEFTEMNLSNSTVINVIDHSLNIIDISMGISDPYVRQSDIESLNLPVIRNMK